MQTVIAPVPRTRSRSLACCLALAVGLSAAACTGLIEGDLASDGDGDGDGDGARDAAPGDRARAPVSPATPRATDDTRPVEVGCEGVRVATAPTRRLTRVEYDNTVRALLGVDGTPATTFTADDGSTGYEVGLGVSPLLAEQYFQAAESLAAAAMERLDALLPCDPATLGEATCAERFIEGFVPRAFRGPVERDELDRFIALYRDIAGEHDFATGIETVIQATLSSPRFLYHVEAAPEERGGEVLPVRGHVMANRLAYFLWSSMPDAELSRAADEGELETPSQVEAHARRMIRDVRTRASIANFARQWLHLDRIELVEKSAELYPRYSKAIGATLAASLSKFVEHVVFDGEGTLGALLTSRDGFVDAGTAEFFGVETRSTSLEMAALGSERSGLLTHPALLAILGKPDQSDPIKRGLFVRERLLCQHLPEPPDDVDLTIDPPIPGVSTRERFAQHTRDVACQSCHSRIDPIGFGFEAFDGVGRWREEDGGQQVDARGELTDAGDASGTFDGAVALGARLAESRDVRDCLASQLLQYALGRPEAADDACSMRPVEDAFTASGGDLLELLVQLTQTDAFLYRRVAADREVSS